MLHGKPKNNPSIAQFKVCETWLYFNVNFFNELGFKEMALHNILRHKSVDIRIM